MGESIKKISESLQLLAAPKPGPGKKRKVKETVPKKKVSPKKRKTTTKKKVVGTPVPKVPEPVQVNPDLIQSPVKDLLRSHGYSLDSIFAGVEDYASSMRPPPQHRIPVSSQSVSDTASLCPDEEWDAENEEPEDLGRGEKRRMYFQGLRNLVPELKHAPVDEAQASGHFSLLHVPDKGDKMPFLGELFDQVSKSGINRSKAKKWTRKEVITKIVKLYPTTQPAEGGLLQPCTVPKELRQLVPNNVLQESGASGLTARLKPTTFEGSKETAAIDSYQYATTNLRLSNNIEIGVEVCNTLVQDSNRHLESLKALDLPDQAKIDILNIVGNLTLLNKTVFDLKSTNNDYLKLSLAQYNQALQNRKEAWVNSTHLPIGVKNELKAADDVQPKKSDPAETRLSMLADTEVKFLQEHNQILRDQLLMRSMQSSSSGFQPRG